MIFQEAECPEDLHILYVSLIQQNKVLAYKFDKDVDSIVEKVDEFD